MPKAGWADTDLAAVLSAGLDLPVAVDTDVNAAALGELRRHYRDEERRLPRVHTARRAAGGCSSRQEQTVTRLLCRGLSTREISERLTITTNTVQDHLKSIFDKVGVRSRRELVTAILQEQYLPRAMAGQPVGPSGFFVD
jgi:DNA-binding NarL/FixJ family response regulator